MRPPGYGVIFVHMPEGNTIGGIDGRHTVVAPTTTGIGLRAAAISHNGFPLPEIIYGVVSKTPGITNRGEYAGT